MFVRKKGNRFYLVENNRTNGKVRQKVIKYLGVNPRETSYLPKLNKIHHAKVEDFLKKLPDDSCDCMIADPPYFISQKRIFTRNGKPINKDFGRWDHGHFQEFMDSWLNDCFRVLKHNLFLFCRFENIGYFFEHYKRYYKTAIVWHKTNPTPHFQKNTFISSCESIIFFQKRKGLFNFLSVNDMHNFIETPNETRRGIRINSTQKHEKLIQWLLEIGSNKNSLVLDLFSGSGIVSGTAKKMERNFIGVENDFSMLRKARKTTV